MDIAALQPFLASVKVNLSDVIAVSRIIYLLNAVGWNTVCCSISLCCFCFLFCQTTLGDINVVLGNEGADLDSCIASIVTAFYLAHSLLKEEKENKLDGNQSFVFPVINCARDDLPLRTEVMFILQKYDIRPETLICRFA